MDPRLKAMREVPRAGRWVAFQKQRSIGTRQARIPVPAQCPPKGEVGAQGSLCHSCSLPTRCPWDRAVGVHVSDLPYGRHAPSPPVRSEYRADAQQKADLQSGTLHPHDSTPPSPP
uniref:Uncharacterized protein n=1 Tax=Eutreptiella gymnastica TaxID=73025 RepID=A0A7S1J3D8_9EUGL